MAVNLFLFVYHAFSGTLQAFGDNILITK